MIYLIGVGHLDCFQVLAITSKWCYEDSCLETDVCAYISLENIPGWDCWVTGYVYDYHIHMTIYTHTHTHTHICVYIYMCVYIYIYIYIYIYEIVNSTRKCQAVFQTACTSWHLNKQQVRIPVAPQLTDTRRSQTSSLLQVWWVCGGILLGL